MFLFLSLYYHCIASLSFIIIFSIIVKGFFKALTSIIGCVVSEMFGSQFITILFSPEQNCTSKNRKTFLNDLKVRDGVFLNARVYRVPSSGVDFMYLFMCAGALGETNVFTITVTRDTNVIGKVNVFYFPSHQERLCSMHRKVI